MPDEMSETVARSALYKLLSLAFLPPREGLADFITGTDRILDALPESHREVLRPIVRKVGAPRGGARDAEYHRLFGVGLAATPYETEYDPLASARKGHRLADLLGFYEAFGFRLAAELKNFPDHVAVELEFMAILLLKVAHARAEAMEDAEAISREAVGKFLADHLGAWGAVFAERVEAETGDELYRYAAQLLKGFLVAECRLLGVEPSALAAVVSRDVDPPTCPVTAECSGGG